MADIMNLANCASPDSTFNSGIPLCDLQRGKIRGILFLDKGVVFTPAEMATPATFIAAVRAKTYAARGGRVYPLFDLTNFEDNTGDPATGSIGNLTTATINVSEAIPAFRFGYNGSEARHRNLSLIGSVSPDVMIIDDKYAVYGTKSGVNFGGYSTIQNYVYTPKFIVADAVNQYSFSVSLGDITQYRENSAFVVANGSLLSVQGLINANLSKLSNAANVFKIKVIADGGTDLGPLYGTALAALTFTATNDSTGASIGVTSVAYDSALQALTVTFDSTAYNALATGATFTLRGPSASALNTANIRPFEIVGVTLVK